MEKGPLTNHPPADDPAGAGERKLRSLLDLGRIISLDLELDEMLLQIGRKAPEVLDAERFSIFLHDPATDELYTTVATGLDEHQQIRMPAHLGLAGHCFKTGDVVNLEDAYRDQRFNREVDAALGFRTRSLLTMPIYNRAGDPLGSVQVLNKISGAFNEEDERLLETFASYVSVFIEMAQLKKARIEALEQSRQELERLNRAKGKALDHLSHELRTPLAIIQGNLRFVKRKMVEAAVDVQWERWFEAIERSLERLFQMQKEVDRILRSSLESLEGRFGGSEAEAAGPEEVRSMLRRLVEGQKPEAPQLPSTFALHPFLTRVAARIRSGASHRDVELRVDVPRDLTVHFSSRILRDMVAGLLRNAVENTPDGGIVTTRAERTPSAVMVFIEDTGIGITEENQKSIFEGLYHAQATDLYSSRNAYDFGAGGKGLDLFRMKLYEQRFGFSLLVESRRCAHIPGEGNVCPGKISLCPHCSQPSDCWAAGGTVFSIALPATA